MARTVKANALVREAKTKIGIEIRKTSGSDRTDTMDEISISGYICYEYEHS
jgi:hypothetical protein